MDKMTHMYERGFLTLEVLIAMTIMITMLMAVVSAEAGIQTLLADGELEDGARQHAVTLFTHIRATAHTDFRVLAPSSTTTTDGFSQTVTLDPWEGDPYAVVRVTGTVSWHSSAHLPQSLEQTMLVGNDDAVDGGDTCESWLTGDWTHPRVSHYKIADLLATSSLMSISDLDIFRGRLSIALSKTGTRTMPTLLVFEMSPTPQYLGGVDNNSAAQTGLAHIVATRRYLYAANPSSFTKGQLQIFDASTTMPVLVKTYKIGTAYVASEGLGTSISYRDGFVRLGLTAVGNGGTEFNTIDVRDPQNPVRTGGIAVGRTINAIVTHQGTTYLATDDTTREAQVVGGANFNAPGMQNWGYGYALDIVGNTLYLGRSAANGDNELYIIDASHPLTGLSPLGSYRTSSSITDMLVRENRVFVVASTSPQFRTIDARDPAHPVLSASLVLPGHGVALDCELNTLYAGSNDDAGNGYLSVITPS